MNASQMNDLFGDSSDDEAQEDVLSLSSAPPTKSNNTPACFGPIYQATRVFVDQHKTITDDLKTNDTIPAHLSNALSEAMRLFGANDDSDTAGRCSTMDSVCELSATCVDAAWTLLHEKKAWPHPCWRELFVVASLMKACALLANAEFLQALQCTDRAFMLGAPKQITNLVFRLVDPLVVVMEPEKTQDAQQGACLPGFNDVVTPHNEAEWEALVERMSPHVQLEQVERKAASEMGDPRQEKEPMVLDGCTDGWNAKTRWLELDFWEQRGYRVVPVEVGKGFMGNNNDNGSIGEAGGGSDASRKKEMKEESMLLGDFVRDYVAPWCGKNVCASASALCSTVVAAEERATTSSAVASSLQQVSLTGAAGDDYGDAGESSGSGSSEEEEDDDDEEARAAAFETVRNGRKRANRREMKVLREKHQQFDLPSSAAAAPPVAPPVALASGQINNNSSNDNTQAPQESRQIAYLAQHNLMDQIPQLRTDFTQPRCSIRNGWKLASSSIWFGTAHTVTLLHYDSYDNFLVQVAGFKYVVLFPTSETANLKAGEQASKKGSVSSYGAQGNTCSVNVASPNLQEHHKYSKAKGWAVLLRPGDTLYIPKGYWHYVRGLTASLSVNFWIEKDE